MPPSYLTRQGYQKLQEELEYLRTVKRQEVANRLHEAMEGGELIENAEYEAAKERQRLVNARMGHLRQRIQGLSLIDVKRIPEDRAGFGSTVTLEDVDSGETKTYRIVHPEEVNAPKGLISLQSPVGQALTGKQEGDEVVVRAATGVRTYTLAKLLTIHDQPE
jgi:transcription elongation factor GreA